jgi:hypothetical protein
VVRIVISEFISLVTAVQGGANEDTDGASGTGLVMQFFIRCHGFEHRRDGRERTDALLYGRRTWQVITGVAGRAGDPFAIERCRNTSCRTPSRHRLDWQPASP